MRGWRRFVSDYGFEGVFKSENIRKFRNASLLLFGVTAMTASGLALFIRMQPTFPIPDCSVKALKNTPAMDRFAHIRGALMKKLKRENISWNDVVGAASRLAPIESQMNEVASLASHLFSHEAQKSWPNAEVLLASLKTGRVVQAIVRDVFDASRDITELIDRIIDKLVDHWIANNYFNSNLYPNREAFGSRQTSEAIGVDIGSTVGSALSDDSLLQILPGDAIRAALVPLQQFGFVQIKDALSFSALATLRAFFGVTGKPSGEIGSELLTKDANISHSRASANRLQLVLRGSKVEDITACIHSAITPLITSYYDRRGVQARLVLTDIRLVVVDHAAHHLPWTAYNPRGGFSVMIPLQSNDRRSGSQAFLPGSHILLETSMNIFRRTYMFFQRYIPFKRATEITELSSDGTWKPGDAFVFDNRLLIRGTANDLFRSGSYILAKYETVDVGPEVFFLRGKVLFRFAQFMNAISSLA